MNEHTMKATEATAAAVDLKRHLLLRVSLFALVIGLAAGAIVLQQAVARIGTHIQRTGNTVERLIAGEADQTRDAFRRSLEGWI
jgi:protein-histidine pros-kinase